jgi:general secretion pathway protein I
MRSASTGSPAASRPARSSKGEAGFTLLETLTALAILAIALVSLFQAQSNGLRAAAAAADYAEARLLGQALLADAVHGWGGPPRSRRGSEGRFNWSIDMAPELAPWAALKSDSWRLYRVRATVAWGPGRRVELLTLKLGQLR